MHCEFGCIVSRCSKITTCSILIRLRRFRWDNFAKFVIYDFVSSLAFKFCTERHELVVCSRNVHKISWKICTTTLFVRFSPLKRVELSQLLSDRVCSFSFALEISSPTFFHLRYFFIRASDRYLNFWLNNSKIQISTHTILKSE